MQVQLIGNQGLGAAYTAGGDGTFGAPPLEIMGLDETGSPGGFPLAPVWSILSIASAGASAYHGYRRNQSVGWAIVWGLLGGMFPVITPAVALAQGFGKLKSGAVAGWGNSGLGLAMRTFIRQHRPAIDAAIKQACPNCRRLNDRERELWILNDESLYRWARRSGVRI